MRRLIAAAVGVGLLVAAPPSQADVLFNLSGVTLSNGFAPAGSLTGSFTTNNALSTVLSFDLTASATSDFAGFEYTPSNSTVTAATLPSQYFQIDSEGSPNELRLYFATGLTAAGGTIFSLASFESEPSGGNRFPSGTVVSAAAVPPASVAEPASVALLGMSVAVLAAMRRRRRSWTGERLSDERALALIARAQDRTGRPS